MNNYEIRKLFTELTYCFNYDDRTAKILDSITLHQSKEIFAEIPNGLVTVLCHESAKRGNLRFVTLCSKWHLIKNKNLICMMMAMAAEECHLDIVQFLLNEYKYNEGADFSISGSLFHSEVAALSLVLTTACGIPCFKNDKTIPSQMSAKEKSIRLALVKEIMNCHIGTIMNDLNVPQILIIHCCNLGFVEMIKYFIEEVKCHPLYPHLGRDHDYGYFCYVASIHNRRVVGEYFFDRALEEVKQSKEKDACIQAFLIRIWNMYSSVMPLNFLLIYNIGSERVIDKTSFQICSTKYYFENLTIFQHFPNVTDFFFMEAKRLGILDQINVSIYIQTAINLSYVKHFEIGIVFNRGEIKNMDFIKAHVDPVKNFWRCMMLDFRGARMDLVENFDRGMFIQCRTDFMINLMELVFENGRKIKKPSGTNIGLYNLIFEYCVDYLNDRYD
ncbi:MAG: hypothetical protein Harvfovirus1_76 [Harvfovirus sp.]|uniref:Uncharacterized protein n=1 Tax=Harvfovirus sp. TaxID=2487768 RepID=A0A3G5A2N0_9VIRU|nr:MAG: hypothetical protein Harvfovirus1_76 [Harvfovirus sp.]